MREKIAFKNKPRQIILAFYAAFLILTNYSCTFRPFGEGKYISKEKSDTVADEAKSDAEKKIPDAEKTINSAESARESEQETSIAEEETTAISEGSYETPEKTPDTIEEIIASAGETEPSIESPPAVESMPEIEPPPIADSRQIAQEMAQESSGSPTTHIVNIDNGAIVFAPEKITITVGDTIKWTNNDPTIDYHLFQSVPGTDPYDKEKDEIEMVTLYGGQNYEHTFNKIGVYPYFCFIHRGMRGKITVVKSGQNVEDMKKELAMLTRKKRKKTNGLKEKLNAKEMVLIKMGKFIMGAPDEPTEGPVRLMELPDFYIDKYEVTNEEYEEFVDTIGYESEGNWRGAYLAGREKHPVVNVTYNDAVSYAKWAGKRLPTEAEWEKAARGNTDKRQWPWGDEFDNEITNVFGPDEYINTAPVGSFEEDVSPYGVYDMAGNVSEWTSDSYVAYEGSEASGHPDFDPRKRAIRGGSFNTINEDQTRTHSRTGSFPQNSFSSVGFRLVRDN